VGSDFSGIESVCLSLQQAFIEHDLVFSSEKNRTAAAIIRSTFKPEHFYDDVTKRHVATMEEVDLFTAGFPCQDFSRLGLQAGCGARRGILIFQSLKYILLKKPTAIVLENVGAFAGSKHSKLRNLILTVLRKAGYKTQEDLLSPWTHALTPQSRSRWYLVAIKESSIRTRGCPGLSMENVFPPIMPMTDEHDDLAHQCIAPLPRSQWQTAPVVEAHQSSAMGQLARDNVLTAYKAAVAKGKNPFKSSVVVDTGSSRDFASYGLMRSPCLTRNRASSFGYWSSRKGGLQQQQQQHKEQKNKNAQVFVFSYNS